MFSNLIPQPRRNALQKLDRHWARRLNSRIASISFTLLSLIAFSASIPTWQANFFHSSGIIRGDWPDGLVLAALAFTLLFDVFVVGHTIQLCRPPRPKRTMSVEVLILLLLTPALTLSVLGSLFIHFSAAIPSNNGTITCSALRNFLSRECSPVLYTVGALQLLGVVFGGIVWILHVSLALWSAFDVRRGRQMSEKESTLERRRQRWRESRGVRDDSRKKRSIQQANRTDTGAYETYGWYR